MFVKERQEKIVELLHEQGNVVVKMLAQHFSVSEDCIRKDLASLEKQGELKRTYGGAVLKRINVHKEYVRERRNNNVSIKRGIAEKALSLVHPGDMIFLDISTSNIELARQIRDSNAQVSVVSNMVEIMQVFSEACNVTFSFIGGNFNRGRDGFIGALTIENLQRYHFDVAFMGVVALDVFNNSVNTYVAEDGLTKRAIMANSKHAYMLCETEKFEQEGNYRYATLDDFTGIILDKRVAKEVEKLLLEHAIELHYAEMSGTVL